MNEGTIHDTVNHPAHYGGDYVYEVIKVIAAWGLNFARGNAVKYIARAGKKVIDRPGVDLAVARRETEIEDLEKAKFYIEWEIARLKGEGR
jgi:hypothetical protein